MGKRQASQRKKLKRERRVKWAMVAAAVIFAIAIIVAIINSQSPSPAAASAVVGGDLHSMVADPNHHEKLFVGGHAGVAVSDDSGHSWHKVSALDGADAMGWAFTSTGTWVGGHPGLRQSRAGDLSFAPMNTGLPASASDIHALGGSGATLYAASPAAGFLTSTTVGTWKIESATSGQAFMGRILIDPSDDRHLLATDMSAGAVESPDGGTTWHPIGGPNSAMWISMIAGDTKRLVVSGSNGVERTDDGGKSWQRVAVPNGATIVEASPSDPKIMWSAAHQGTAATVWRSADEGASWQRP